MDTPWWTRPTRGRSVALRWPWRDDACPHDECDPPEPSIHQARGRPRLGSLGIERHPATLFRSPVQPSAFRAARALGGVGGLRGLDHQVVVVAVAAGVARGEPNLGRFFVGPAPLFGRAREAARRGEIQTVGTTAKSPLRLASSIDGAPPSGWRSPGCARLRSTVSWDSRVPPVRRPGAQEQRLPSCLCRRSTWWRFSSGWGAPAENGADSFTGGHLRWDDPHTGTAPERGADHDIEQRRLAWFIHTQGPQLTCGRRHVNSLRPEPRRRQLSNAVGQQQHLDLGLAQCRDRGLPSAARSRWPRSSSNLASTPAVSRPANAWTARAACSSVNASEPSSERLPVTSSTSSHTS